MFLLLCFFLSFIQCDAINRFIENPWRRYHWKLEKNNFQFKISNRNEFGQLLPLFTWIKMVFYGIFNALKCDFRVFIDRWYESELTHFWTTSILQFNLCCTYWMIIMICFEIGYEFDGFVAQTTIAELSSFVFLQRNTKQSSDEIISFCQNCLLIKWINLVDNCGLSDLRFWEC